MNLSLIQAALAALALSLAVNVGLGAWIVSLLEDAGAANTTAATLRDAVKAHAATVTRVQQGAAECAQQLGAVRTVTTAALDERDTLQARLDALADTENTERESLYAKHAECRALANCRVCDPLAGRMRDAARRSN